MTTHEPAVAIYDVPRTSDLATLAANTNENGTLLTIHLVSDPSVQVAKTYTEAGWTYDEYTDWAKDALDCAGYVMTGYRATGENWWVLEGAPMLDLGWKP